VLDNQTLKGINMFTRVVGIFLMASWLSVTGNLKAGQTMEVRYWDWGHTSLRDSYSYELLELILEKTRATYGDYSLSKATESFTTARVRRELSRGKIFNVQVAPWRPVKATGLEAAIRIDIDIFKGLSGYRQLIIRSQNRGQFEKMSKLGELQQYTAGTGRGWVDADIFLDNGFKVNSDASSETLFPMLGKNRFDFVSLGVLEAKEFMDKTPLNNLLVIAENPLLYMPFPFVFYVSIHEPVLAERIETGLTMAIDDGSFELLFNQHFSSHIDIIQSHKDKFLFLQNPRLPENMQINPDLLNEHIE
jgi:hypothetical protein